MTMPDKPQQNKNRTDEDFSGLKREVQNALTQEGFAHFLGYRPEMPIIFWNHEIGGGWKEFLAVARTLQVRVLYLNWVEFTEATVEEALSELSEDETTDDSDDLEEMRVQIEEFRRFSGRVASFEMGFLFEGLFHVYEKEAIWYQDFGEVLAEEEETDDEESEPPAELIREWSEKLASHPKYGSLKGYQHRDYLLRTLAGDMYENLPTHRILSEADCVYELNYREKDESRLVEEVRTLRAQGLSIVKIAGRTGLSKDRVSMLADKAGESGK